MGSNRIQLLLASLLIAGTSVFGMDQKHVDKYHWAKQTGSTERTFIADRVRMYELIMRKVFPNKTIQKDILPILALYRPELLEADPFSYKLSMKELPEKLRWASLISEKFVKHDFVMTHEDLQYNFIFETTYYDEDYIFKFPGKNYSQILGYFRENSTLYKPETRNDRLELKWDKDSKVLSIEEIVKTRIRLFEIAHNSGKIIDLFITEQKDGTIIAVAGFTDGTLYIIKCVNDTWSYQSVKTNQKLSKNRKVLFNTQGNYVGFALLDKILLWDTQGNFVLEHYIGDFSDVVLRDNYIISKLNKQYSSSCKAWDINKISPYSIDKFNFQQLSFLCLNIDRDLSILKSEERVGNYQLNMNDLLALTMNNRFKNLFKDSKQQKQILALSPFLQQVKVMRDRREAKMATMTEEMKEARRCFLPVVEDGIKSYSIDSQENYDLSKKLKSYIKKLGTLLQRSKNNILRYFGYKA